MRLFPELANAYGAVRMAELLAKDKITREVDQAGFVERVRQQLGERIAAGEKIADPQRDRSEPDRERER